MLCPTCGTPVYIKADDEGTAYYEPTSRARIILLEDEIRELHRETVSSEERITELEAAARAVPEARVMDEYGTEWCCYCESDHQDHTGIIHNDDCPWAALRVTLEER